MTRLVIELESSGVCSEKVMRPDPEVRTRGTGAPALRVIPRWSWSMDGPGSRQESRDFAEVQAVYQSIERSIEHFVNAERIDTTDFRFQVPFLVDTQYGQV